MRETDSSSGALTELHAFLARAERASAGLRGRAAQQLAALETLAELHGDAPALLDRCRANRWRSETLRLIAAFARFWWIRGLGESVRARVDAAFIEIPPEVEPRIVGAARQGAGELAYARADYSTARAQLQRASRAHVARGSDEGEAHALNWLGMVDREQGRYPDARRRHGRALELFVVGGHEWGRAHALGNLGVVAFREGRLREAQELHERALEVRRELDDLHGVSSSVGNLALIHRSTGDYATARPLYRESLDARVRLGDTWGIAGSNVCLCVVETRLGDRESARRHLRSALQGFIAVGDALGIAESAEAATELFLESGTVREAALAHGVAREVRRLIDAPHAAEHHEVVIRLTDQLGGEELHAHEASAAGVGPEELGARLLALVAQP